jgi:hypothetical protein
MALKSFIGAKPFLKAHMKPFDHGNSDASMIIWQVATLSVKMYTVDRVDLTKDEASFP